MEPVKKNSLSATGIISAFLLVITVLVAGMYIYSQSESAQVADRLAQPLTPVAVSRAGGAGNDAAAVALSIQDTSDEVGSIDKDLQGTDLSSLNDVSKI